MLLIFSVVHPADGDIRPLVFYSERLELSIDLLNYYVKGGFNIVLAVVRETSGVETALPIEAIDGEKVADYIWESILKNRS